MNTEHEILFSFFINNKQLGYEYLFGEDGVYEYSTGDRLIPRRAKKVSCKSAIANINNLINEKHAIVRAIILDCRDVVRNLITKNTLTIISDRLLNYLYGYISSGTPDWDRRLHLWPEYTMLDYVFMADDDRGSRSSIAALFLFL